MTSRRSQGHGWRTAADAFSRRVGPAQRRWLRRIGIVALPFLLAIVLFAPSTVGGDVLSASQLPTYAAPYVPPAAGTAGTNPLQYDAAFVFEPDGLTARAALRSGHLPSWTPTLSEGSPLLAQSQTAPLYPLTWLDVAFDYFNALVWIAVLKLVLAALGTYLFARLIGLRTGPALLAGLGFAFGSYMIDWLEHPHTNIYLLLPWLTASAELLCRRASVRDSAYLAVLIGLALLGGQPESVLLVLSVAVLWGVFRLAVMRPARRQLGRIVVLAVVGGLLGGGIGAVMWMPLLQLAGQTPSYSRSVPGMSSKIVYSLLFPEWWGRPDGGSQSVGPLNFAERTSYVGALPLILAVAGLLSRRHRREQLFFVVVAVLGILIAIRPGPIGTLLDHHVPVVDSIDLNRTLVLSSFAIAVLGGYGLDALLSEPPAQRIRIALVATAVGLLPVLAVIVVHAGWLGGLRPAAHRLVDRDLALSGSQLALASVLRWLVLVVLALVVIAALTLGRYRRVAVATALILTAVDLGAMGWNYNASIAKDVADPPPSGAVTAMRRLTAGPNGGRVIGIASMVPNTASRWGLHDALSHEDPMVWRNQQLQYALGAVPSVPMFVSGADPRTRTLLDVDGVRAVVLPPGTVKGHEDTDAPVLAGDKVVYNGPSGVVLANPSALPQAFVAYRWRRSSGLDQSLAMMRVGSVPSDRDEPVIETGATSPAGSGPGATSARIVSRGDTSLTIHAVARRAGQLIVLDTYYPGWVADVDGHRTPIRPALGAFDAISVSRGSHVIKLEFRSQAVSRGVDITIISLILTAALLSLGLWRAASGREDEGHGRRSIGRPA